MKLGANQRSTLESLLEHHGWYPGCGWIWDTRSGTIRILESLIKKGLAEREPNRMDSYRITEAGKDDVLANSVYYRLKYTKKD